MPIIKVYVEAEVKKKFPEVMVAGFRASGLRAAIQKIDVEALMAQSCLQYKALGTEQLSTHPLIEAWRQGYKHCGVKSSKFRSSIEALARRAARGDSILTGNSLVDLYNAVSLKHMAPLGAYDVSKLDGDDVKLRFANPQHDRFSPLGAQAASFPLSQNVVVYAVGDEVVCWGFNCRDSSTTCLEETTDQALFFSECAMAVHHERAKSVLEDLVSILVGVGAECGQIGYTAGLEQPANL